MEYQEFLHRRNDLCNATGFDPIELPGFLFDFQASLVAWAVKMGRCAIFAECGLGKTAMQLVWADNVARKTGKPVLIMTPLAVSHQTAAEAKKFGIECCVSRDGVIKSKIIATNYERLHYFDPSKFAGVVCDESSALKDFKSKRKDAVVEFVRGMKYRLLCTATAAPNDYHELGTSSEVLGYLGYRDMISTFFKQETSKDHLGWGRTKYRFRGHAERPFWRWVCSWARAIRKPSDLGFSDERFILPPLVEKEVLVEKSSARAGFLFPVPATTMREQLEERRVSMRERCETAAQQVNGSQSIVWCHLNPEGDMLAKIIPDAVQVSGSMKDEQKEERLLEFAKGNIRTLVTKPKIACWGLNFQNCHNIITFPSDSFEQYYQLVRRCWRFGQESPVDVSIITTEGQVGVMKNLSKKAAKATVMFESLVACMNNELRISSVDQHTNKEDVPVWLQSHRQ